MTKYLIAAIAALMLLLTGVGYSLKAQIKKNGAQATKITALEDVLEAAATQRKADQALLARRAREKAAIALEMASTRQQLDRALAANPDWANQPIPQEVQDALKP